MTIGQSNNTSQQPVQSGTVTEVSNFNGIENNDPAYAQFAQDPYSASGPRLKLNFLNFIAENKNQHDLQAYHLTLPSTIPTIVLVAYCPLAVAQQIYQQYYEVMDAQPASPIWQVDGSILNWLKFANKLDQVRWYQFAVDQAIASQFQDYVPIGVFCLTNVLVEKELRTNLELDINLPYYQKINYLAEEDTLIKVGNGLSGSYVFITQNTIEQASIFDEDFILSNLYRVENGLIEIAKDESEILLTYYPQLQPALISQIDYYTYFNYLQFSSILYGIITEATL